MHLQFTIKDATALAANKSGVDGWLASSWEAIEGGSLVCGCVPDGIYKAGKKVGKPRFDKPIKGTEKKIIVLESELEKEAKKYEAENKKCWNCKGKGKVFSSWNHVDGTKYAECKRCSGSGIAPSSLSNQVQAARQEYDSWPQSRKDGCQLQGSK